MALLADTTPSGTTPPVQSPRASVCIATHKRPDSLERLLTSLTEQEGAPPFDVVVVDNDGERTGRAVADRFVKRLHLTYLAEPTRGLARVRNHAVAASLGTFLAFIDDDEWATPQWLATLDGQAEDSHAAVVVGPVITVFDEEVPDYIRSCSLFDRGTVADGETVPWYFTHTSNAYVRRTALPHRTEPFAAAFDLTGGEDVDLFSRMIGRGAHIVGAAKALVFEQRPVRRANLRWVLRRALRNGTNRVELEWADLSRRRRVARGFGAGLGGFREGILGAAAWRSDRRRAIAHFIGMAEQFGQFAGVLGMKIRKYRIHP